MIPEKRGYLCGSFKAPYVPEVPEYQALTEPRFESKTIQISQHETSRNMDALLQPLYAEGWSLVSGSSNMLFLERPIQRVERSYR